MKLTALYTNRYLPHARRTLKPRTVAEYARLINKLVLPRFGEQTLQDITLDAVETWHESVPGAVQANRALAALSSMLTYAIERRLLTVNPCHGVSLNKEKGREFFYPPAESQAILRAALAWPDIRGRYIALALLTGCRPGELEEVQVSWRTRGVIRLPDSKTGSRTLYLSAPAEAILDNLAREFPQPDGRYFPAGMDLRRAWYTVVRLAGVQDARRYDLRHTFASAALAAGIGLDVVGLMLGHRKRETTLKYAHLAPDVGVNAAAAAATRMGA